MKAGGINQKETFHQPAAVDHGLAGRLSKDLGFAGGIDAHHEAVATYADAHLAIHHEAEPAEHGARLEEDSAVDEDAGDAVRELEVVGQGEKE